MKNDKNLIVGLIGSFLTGAILFFAFAVWGNSKRDNTIDFVLAISIAIILPILLRKKRKLALGTIIGILLFFVVFFILLPIFFGG